ncbi:arylamine N-acetyltransferase family protein [Variovorax saccharolyticus]|uniref:arylamine N-acetyltransferase family protein n=1 Tax=Variovorax saccharolyticus TaxID=3053516 RepID=UPI002575B3E1|nr:MULTISPECIES: arylamine N-acetyltransferase [unclassified Variovorax]MDM0022490.1 arylamine N-acetyltransferase [Variovorax sp. J22R187]MDM0028254.1 arylamine N-acetyltransferase [Variovorax sp. J31P216]
MTGNGFDRDAWLMRILYAGPLAPTLETLRGLVFSQAHAIAYESLDITLGRVPKLGVPELQRKMVDHQRGGYCFELNMLFRAGLRSLGYRVTSLQGRVVRGMAIDAPRPAIHMLLQVELPQGPYLADVGFGNLAPTAPLVLAPHVEQPTPHGLMRFIEVNGELTLQQLLGQRWEHIYRVIPYPRYDAEYEVANWYTATHPDAPYPNNMIAARPLPDGSRLTMFNDRVTLRASSGESHRRNLETPEAFAAVLREEFALAVPDRDLYRMLQVVEQRGTRGAPHPFFA